MIRNNSSDDNNIGEDDVVKVHQSLAESEFEKNIDDGDLSIKTVDADHASDSNNKFVSEDTERRSSLACFDIGNCNNSPDYFMTNSPFSNDEMEDIKNYTDMSTFKIKRSGTCTSTVSFSKKLSPMEKNALKVESSLVQKNVQEKATSPIKHVKQEKTTSPIMHVKQERGATPTEFEEICPKTETSANDKGVSLDSKVMTLIPESSEEEEEDDDTETDCDCLTHKILLERMTKLEANLEALKKNILAEDSSDETQDELSHHEINILVKKLAEINCDTVETPLQNSARECSHFDSHSICRPELLDPEVSSEAVKVKNKSQIHKNKYEDKTMPTNHKIKKPRKKRHGRKH